MVNDDIADHTGPRLATDLFIQVFQDRMKRLIAPAQEHGKLLLMHTKGKIDPVLPVLHEIGFDAVHPVEPECNDILAIKKQWSGKMALVGNIPTTLLARSSRDEIEETVRQYCAELAPGGGYVLSSSNGIGEGVLPENFVAMTQAVHKYGRYGSLGEVPRSTGQMVPARNGVERR